jgi:hypothetical protein
VFVLILLVRFSNTLWTELAILAPLGFASGIVNTLITTRVSKEVHPALMGPYSYDSACVRAGVLIVLFSRECFRSVCSARLFGSDNSATNRWLLDRDLLTQFSLLSLWYSPKNS